MNKSKIIKTAGRILSIASIGFIIYAVSKLGMDFSFVRSVPGFILIVIIGIIMKLASLWLSASSWTAWLSFFAKNPFQKNRARIVFMRANIGKYIPGNVMHFVQRNLFASDMGISQIQLAMSTIVEIASYVFVAFSVAVLTARKGLENVLQSYFGDRIPNLWIVCIVVAACLVCAIMIFRKRIREILKDYTLQDFLKTLITVMLLQAFILALLGAVLALLVWYAQGNVSIQTVGIVISTYILAWVLGYIVPGASGGIGIREMALLLLLGPVLGESLTLSLSIVHRLITIIGDFLGYLIAIILERQFKGAK